MKWKSQIKLNNISTKFGSICFSDFSEKLKSEKQMYEDHNNRPKWWQNFICGFAVLWFVCWCYFVCETPSKHTTITNAELEYIHANIGYTDEQAQGYLPCLQYLLVFRFVF
jgi:hypothetical protein